MDKPLKQHVRKTRWQLGQESLRRVPRQEANAPDRLLQHPNLGCLVQPFPIVLALAQNRAKSPGQFGAMSDANPNLPEDLSAFQDYKITGYDRFVMLR
ncbi:hypothetical protein [Thiomonas sp. X19]|uniref:hypothetical protein n=1 Tax=Thiomonas sp. X19 TaxID=1050370 RepID=UPI0011BF0363|nr:hypothetical protein [Thiomonas sp. X19]